MSTEARARELEDYLGASRPWCYDPVDPSVWDDDLPAEGFFVRRRALLLLCPAPT